MRLENKVAIVTGAVGGIDGEIVKHFVAEGARVLAVDLDQSKVDALAECYGAQVLGAVADVTDYAQVAATIDKAVEHFGTLDGQLTNTSPTTTLLAHGSMSLALSMVTLPNFMSTGI